MAARYVATYMEGGRMRVRQFRTNRALRTFADRHQAKHPGSVVRQWRHRGKVEGLSDDSTDVMPQWTKMSLLATGSMLFYLAFAKKETCDAHPPILHRVQHSRRGNCTLPRPRAEAAS